MYAKVLTVVMLSSPCFTAVAATKDVAASAREENITTECLTSAKRKLADRILAAYQKAVPKCMNSDEDPQNVKLLFPVFDKRQSLVRAVVPRLPNPVVISKIPSSAGKLLSSLMALESVSLTLALGVMWAIISGIIVWALDHSVNSDQFPEPFFHGVKEASWWALVTMTTVGYGDKTPKGLLARAYSVFWMLVGIVTISIVTAEISSTLTTKQLEKQQIKKVGVPEGGLHFFGDVSHYQGDDFFEVSAFSSLAALKEALDSNKVDAIVAHYCPGFDKEQYHAISWIRFPPHAIGIDVYVEDDDNEDEEEASLDDDLVSCLKKDRRVVQVMKKKLVHNNNNNNNNSNNKNNKNTNSNKPWKKRPCAKAFKGQGKTEAENVKLDTLYILIGSAAVLVLLLAVGGVYSWRFQKTHDVAQCARAMGKPVSAVGVKDIPLGGGVASLSASGE